MREAAITITRYREPSVITENGNVVHHIKFVFIPTPVCMFVFLFV